MMSVQYPDVDATQQEVLPPDYQEHLDKETVDEKMVRLDEEMKDLMDKINNKVKAPF